MKCQKMFFLSLVLAGAAQASGEAQVPIRLVSATGASAPIGTLRLVQTRHGLAIYPQLTGLSPGLHGFHVHENPSCDPGLQGDQPIPALAAGGHLDLTGSKKHGEPWGDGHVGDLPPLYVAADGTASQPVLAPRLKLSDVHRRAIVIHVGGDNHADHPMPLGGGGGRVACGVIETL